MPFLLEKIVATIIDISKVTSGDTGGTGTFEILSASIGKQLEREYDAGRIVGADYASAYISGLNAAMSQAIQFELSKAQAGFSADVTEQNAIAATAQAKVATDTANNQIALSDEQLAQSLVQGNILDTQKSLNDEQLLQAVKQTSLVTTQDEIATATKDEQIAIVENNKLLSDEQVTQALVAGDIQDNQKIISNNEVTVSTGTVQSRIDLSEEQELNLQAQTKVTLERGGFR